MKFHNVKKSDWNWINTPAGALLYIIDSMTGNDDASMCATSQIVPGFWVMDDGSWTSECPDILAIDATPEPIDESPSYTGWGRG